jgi:hypothetical protein
MRSQHLLVHSGLAATVISSPVADGISNLEPRLNNGLGRTPALGWNSWVCYLGQLPYVLTY